MKKLFLAICMVLISASSFAQQGKSTLGVHGNYMIDSPNNLGLGANYGYEFAENLRGVAEFDYFLKKDYVSFWNAGANVEYLFKLADGKMIFYPMAGLDVLGISWENGGSDSKLGLNLGVGFEYPVSSSLSLKLEYNYKTEYDGFSVLKFGVVVPL
jgi:opacity protein-like surface antigen